MKLHSCLSEYSRKENGTFLNVKPKKGRITEAYEKRRTEYYQEEKTGTIWTFYEKRRIDHIGNIRGKYLRQMG